MANYIFLLLAILVGLASAWAGSKQPKPWNIRGVIKVASVGFVGTCIAAIVSTLFTTNAFSGIHVVYLVGTIGIPLFAVLALTKSAGEKLQYKIALSILILLAPLGIYMTHIEPFWLRVDSVDLAVGGLEKEIRIGVLSDLQTPEIGEYEMEAITSLLAENPDIILIPGDFWQGPDKIFNKRADQFINVMQKLDQEVEHVYVVSGNTDTVEDLKVFTKGTNVVVLENELQTFEFEGQKINIAGIGVYDEANIKQKAVTELAESESENVFTILLAHKPDGIFFVPDDQKVDIVVSGHTHGGQISVPIFGPPLTLSKVPRHIGAGGLHELDGQNIYVSTGVGRERDRAPQMRLGVRPSFGIINVS